MNHKTRCSGFSLIEVLVAFAIAGVSIVLLSEVFSSSVKNIALSAQYSEAAMLANSLLDEISGGVEKPIPEGSLDKFRWFRHSEPFADSDISKFEDNANPVVLYRTIVHVSWDSGSNVREVELQRLTFRPHY